MDKKILEAINFAINAHDGQLKKGTTHPYINHPLNVGFLLMADDVPIEYIIAGILHDTLEDTPIQPDDIILNFGQRVLDIIEINTENKNFDWEKRKLDTIEKIKKLSYEESLFMLADKLDNLEKIFIDYTIHGDNIWSRFNRDSNCQRWYYSGILNEFKKNEKIKKHHYLMKYEKLIDEIWQKC